MATTKEFPAQPSKKDETPIYYEVLEAQKTTEPKFREETKALDPQSWAKAVEAQ